MGDAVIDFHVLLWLAAMGPSSQFSQIGTREGAVDRMYVQQLSHVANVIAAGTSSHTPSGREQDALKPGLNVCDMIHTVL